MFEMKRIYKKIQNTIDRKGKKWKTEKEKEKKNGVTPKKRGKKQTKNKKEEWCALAAGL